MFGFIILEIKYIEGMRAVFLHAILNKQDHLDSIWKNHVEVPNFI